MTTNISWRVKAYKYQAGQSRKGISQNVFFADNFFRRFSGLLFRKPLKNDEVFVIKGCKSIHTIGMMYGLDAAFINSKGIIIALFEDLGPWKITPYIRDAVSVLEARSGFLKKRSLDIGDRIIFE